MCRRPKVSNIVKKKNRRGLTVKVTVNIKSKKKPKRDYIGPYGNGVPPGQ